jgi:hypothetical protein
MQCLVPQKILLRGMPRCTHFSNNLVVLTFLTFWRECRQVALRKAASSDMSGKKCTHFFGSYYRVAPADLPVQVPLAISLSLVASRSRNVVLSRENVSFSEARATKL